ncbi:ParB/RepB/Spo0J family partition protein [Deinococcus ruber]|uniref:ParB-like N-terminal domain-containing protein n=1 Tax=Deinococcus ruber TaxID=1848197 RepID=A0A918FET3_9DEIO|nr:ParB/RepB/Spo0J family partition protein [Deinococcus ruber]GGR31522.1 hypothetical protein GCM10008957_47810 [Deinococcus ruber]
MKLRTDQIRTDGGTQMRVGPYHEDVLSDYGDVIQNGGSLPPLVVFFDAQHYWLADGFHRLKAYKTLNVREVEAEVKEGSKRDAILFAVGANASHGLRRTNADKRRAVETLLKDEEWSGWTDREIARRSHTSAPLVGKLRSEVTVNIYSEQGSAEDGRKYTTKHGTQATMNTANIGQRPPSPMSSEPQALRVPSAESLREPEAVAPRQPVVDKPAAPSLPDDEFGPIKEAPAFVQPPIQRPSTPRPMPQLPPDYRPGADPNIPPRVDALRKALDRLLSFDKDGPELLEHPGANLMQLSLLAEYTREMLEGWLHPEEAQPSVRTITVEALN